MMGFQPSSNFLGIEASRFNFSSLICMRAFVICFVKAIFIALALGLLENFCKNLITSEILQSSKSKSLLSKVKELLSPILRNFLALLSEIVSVILGNFVEGVGTFPTPIILPLIVRRFDSI